MYVNIPPTYKLPKIQQDQQLEEFLSGEICCQNFINQYLTFLQPSVIHAPQPKETKVLLQEKTTEISPIDSLENSPLQDRNFHPVPLVEFFMIEADLLIQQLPFNQWNLLLA